MHLIISRAKQSTVNIVFFAMLWCNFTWLGFMQTIVGDYSKSNKNTFPSKYATMCIILIKNSSHPEKTKYPLLNISVQWFSWSKLHSNPAHPINAPNISHTLWTAFVFRIVTTKSPKGLHVVVGSWQKNPNHEYCEAKSYSSCFNIYVQRLILVFWPP